MLQVANVIVGCAPLVRRVERAQETVVQEYGASMVVC